MFNARRSSITKASIGIWGVTAKHFASLNCFEYDSFGVIKQIQSGAEVQARHYSEKSGKMQEALVGRGRGLEISPSCFMA
jgi:hypothetical protein